MDEEFELAFRQGKCCACGKSMRRARTRYINFVMVKRIATWEFPVHGSFVSGEPANGAVAIVCDACAKKKSILKIRLVVELTEECKLRYHDVKTLEDSRLPPPPPPRVPEEDKRAYVIDRDTPKHWKCLACGTPIQEARCIGNNPENTIPRTGSTCICLCGCVMAVGENGLEPATQERLDHIGNNLRQFVERQTSNQLFIPNP